MPFFDPIELGPGFLAKWRLKAPPLPIGAHYFNFYYFADSSEGQISYAYGLYMTPYGLTGHLLILVLVPMVLMARESTRKKLHHLFQISHMIAVPAWTVLICIHGAYGFFAGAIGQYTKFGDGAVAWKTTLPGLILYILDMLYGYFQVRTWSRSTLVEYTEYACGVLELRFKSTCSGRAKKGRYVRMRVPEIAFTEIHPFTLSNNPSRPDIWTLHIGIDGDWTQKLAARLRKGDGFPQMLVEGPFGSASEDMKRFENIICVAAGVGITPFMPLIHLMANATVDLKLKSEIPKNVVIHWICRDHLYYEILVKPLRMLTASRNCRVVMHYTGPQLAPASLQKMMDVLDPSSSLQPEMTRVPLPRADDMVHVIEVPDGDGDSNRSFTSSGSHRSVADTLNCTSRSLPSVISSPDCTSDAPISTTTRRLSIRPAAADTSHGSSSFLRCSSTITTAAAAHSMTADPEGRVRHPSFEFRVGRPKMSETLQESRTDWQPWGVTDVGVFMCGGPTVSALMHEACNEESKGNFHFYYHKESF
ncbi:hypothetical protein BDK51DRAFT_43821 [Blyttiomyces helicus]|uniref:FAD-binding FR-type domain-containing protein n=1 Tax=Blyttiomyces helicus TaxID=388810 RepID=A0A4P9WG27_9FUNG|nr:hypothetical protein BDK51DRAFT_43821 [Blyttiomyces helicus]|eukprot:RKO90753.1 hypothetical protein BDK51DRAFT_43821 [Blyttiomyces helicus]